MEESRANVKIFGERNSATNALKRLIERNSRSRVLPSVAKELDPRFESRTRLLARLPMGPRLKERYLDGLFRGEPPRFSWKHTATEFDDVECFGDCAVVFAVRHPASWLLALHRRPYHASRRVPAAFSAFLAAQWSTVERDNLGRRSLVPAELWNAKVRSYFAFSRRLLEAGIPCRWVLFEDFVHDQARAFEKLRDLLLKPAKTISPVTESTKEASKGFEYYRDYYGKKRWLADMDEASRTQIHETVDWRLAAQFGYRRL